MPEVVVRDFRPGDGPGVSRISLDSGAYYARIAPERDLAKPRLFISYVGTADAFKRMGVATRLVEAAEEWGRSKGAVAAVCDTYIASPLSVPFWEERMGYERRAIIFRKAL